MRLILKLLAAPVVVALTLFVWICSGLLYCSAFVFGLAGTIVAILGVAVRQDSAVTVCHSGQDIWIRQQFGA